MQQLPKMQTYGADCMSIAELTQKRLSHVESCRNNGDNSHRIIANLYSDSTHFLYELLQNAQDAEAAPVSFELHPDRLETSHNGRAFSFSDVESITTIGSSTKSNEPNKIGKFGAGFKSVFSITDTPHIYSGTYNFKISDYIIPETINPLENQSDERTSVVLPFDRAEIDVKTLYDSIAKRLRSIGKDELLFLSNLCRIDWKIGDEAGYVEKAIDEGFETRSLVILETHNKTERFELYRRGFTIENKLFECKIAFALNADDRYISIGTNPLYVFFPTVVPTNLQFLVHAPYKTTPNRETINFSDPQNQTITDNIVELYKSILKEMAERKVLDVETMGLLPLSSQSGELSQKLFAASIELFKTHPLIPTQEGGYALPEEIFTVSQNVNAELFRESHVEKLFDKSVWLHSDFLEFKYIVMKRFLTQNVEVKEYPLEQIIKPFNADFLSAQSDEWIAAFYAECAKDPYRVNSYLASHPFARLEDGTHMPFKANNGDVQVYSHPQIPTQFQCIHPKISSSAMAVPFFMFIGLKTPDVIDEIKEFILPELIVLPKDQYAIENYFQRISTLLRTYDDSNQSDQKRIVELIKSTACILTIQHKLARPQDVYLPTEPLKRWFVGDETIAMMGNTLWDVLSSTGLGASLPFQICPEIKMADPHIDSAHKERLRHTPSIADRGGDDFQWVGLELLLSSPIDKVLSLIIWNFLITYLDEKRNILRGYYRWQGPANNHEKEFDSKICVLLKQTAWLYDKEGIANKPIELKLEELSEEYRYDALGVDVKELLSLLSFKTDAIEDLEKRGYKVISPDEAEAFEIFKKMQQQAIEEEEPVLWNPASPSIAKWVSETDPDMKADIETFEPKPKKPKDLRNQTPQSFFEEEMEESYRPFVPKAIRKHIGEWSERYVYRYLQDFCKENKDKGYHVRWMNEEKNVGWGYDFVLMKGEKELRYIEVKGRSSNTSEIEISKTQWEFAKFLFDKGEGDKYSIFIVQNVGKTNAKLIPINNPVKMWLDGNLSMLKIELSY
jgi:hypothetical protein